MPRRHLHRLATAFLVVLSLLFSQLALATYVCPGEADVDAMTAMIDGGQSCAGMDDQQPALCHAHTVPVAKTFEAVKLPVLGQPAVVQVLQLPPVLDVLRAQAVPPSAVPDIRPPPDPLFLSTLRLRV